MGYGEVHGDLTNQANVTSGRAYFGNWGGQDPATFAEFGIPVWDQYKSRMCVCDPKWTDLDCSRRMCPKGNDVLDTRTESDHASHSASEPLDYQVQDIILVAGGVFGDGLSSVTRQTANNVNTPTGAGTNGIGSGDNNPGVGVAANGRYTIDTTVAAMSTGIVGTNFGDRSFALTFTSNLNETYTTAPIELRAGAKGCGNANAGSSMTFADQNCATSDDNGFIANALLSLPNKVIDGVTVTTSVVSTSAQYMHKISVTFTGDSVQGKQNLLEVEDFACGDGCTPKRQGPVLTSPETKNKLHKYNPAVQLSYVHEARAADWNAYECGRRGKCDYDSGLCECFEGYYGEACGYQSALV